MKSSIRHIGAFLMLIMLSTKMSPFHIYEHHFSDEDNTSCELCLLTLESQKSEILPFSITDFEIVSLTFDDRHIVYTQGQSTSKDFLTFFHLSRPPPAKFLEV